MVATVGVGQCAGTGILVKAGVWGCAWTVMTAGCRHGGGIGGVFVQTHGEGVW